MSLPPLNVDMLLQELQFDIFSWNLKYQACLDYFLDHAQHSEPIQIIATFLNINLPYQKAPAPASSLQFLTPDASSSSSSLSVPTSALSSPRVVAAAAGHYLSSVTLIPYIRRLIVTGLDSPNILHAFFGHEWREGIGLVHEAERIQYLFAAKCDTWLHVKAQYDMDDEQSVPFLRPLQNVSIHEIEAAEAKWSEWLAMQDWMLGQRFPI